MGIRKQMTVLVTVVTMCNLTGCGGVSECNESQTKETALNIIDTNLSKAVWYQQMKANITDAKISEISTMSKDEELEKRSCSGTYSFNYKGKNYEKDFEYELKYLEDEDSTMVSVDVETIKQRVMAIAMFAQ
jgi:hypothetical protein